METVRFNRVTFLKTLEVGGQCVSDGKGVPMMKQVRVTIKDSRVKIESTSEISSVRSFGDCISAGEDFAFCIGFKEFFGYIKAISSGEFSITKKQDEIIIEHEDGETSLPCFPAIDFPEAAKPEADLPQCRIDGAMFRHWLASSKNFVANDTLRPNINGINLVANRGKLYFAASDSKALIFEEVDFDPSAEFDFIIDSKAFPAILSVVHDCDMITMMVSSTTVFLSMPSAKMSVRRTVGQFPKVKTIMPTFTPLTAVVSKDKLNDAIQRIRVSTSEVGARVKFSFSDGLLGLIFEDLINRRYGKEQLEIDYAGEEPIEISFNVNNFNKCLSAIECKNIKIGMTHPTKPAVLYDADGEEAGLKTMLTPVLFNVPAKAAEDPKANK